MLSIRHVLSILLFSLMCTSLTLGSRVHLSSRRIPIKVPVPVKQSTSAPRDLPQPPSTQMPMLEVPHSPEARSWGLYEPEEFPADPPKRARGRMGDNAKHEPLPLSPPGTYMHTAVRIGDKMYVYGGVVSYEENKYMNDLWLFDFGASEYVQLQGNYVPPLPTHAGLSDEDAETFAPKDVPAMPGLATAPRNPSVKIEPLHPNSLPSSPFLPRRRAARPVRVVPLEHIYLKDAHKPLASGTGNLEQTLAGHAKINLPPPAKDQQPAASFLQTEQHLSMHHQQRTKFMSRTMRVLRGGAGAHAIHPSNNFPGDRRGSPYASARFYKDGEVASKNARGQQPAIQTVEQGAATPHSAPNDSQDSAPYAKQDLWSYDFTTHQWELVQIASSQPLAHSPWLTPAQLKDPVFKDPLPILLPPTRRLHTSVVMKDRMVVFGGVSYNNLILGDLWIFDPAEASWLEASADGPGGSPILPREGHTAIALMDGLSMLVFGGVSYGFLPFNDLWKYSAVDNTWVRLSSGSGEDQNAPMQRWLHTAVLHKNTNSMIVFGGLTAHYVPLNDVQIYDIASNSWHLQTCIDTPPMPRMMHVAVTIRDIMLVTGGAANNLPLEDLFVLDLKTWRWRELIQTNGYPFARTGATAIVLSPLERAMEQGLPDDISPDAADPHLQWAVDHEKVAARPIVGSFSNEGLDDHEETKGSIRGLDQIAFPTNPIAGLDGNAPASQRPLFRYRKHSRNSYFFVLFGGASATTAPTDETTMQKESE